MSSNPSELNDKVSSQTNHEVDAPSVKAEFRHYRLGLAVAYLLCAGVGSTLLIVSIVLSLTREVAAEEGRPLTVSECHDEISQVTHAMRSRFATPSTRHTNHYTANYTANKASPGVSLEHDRKLGLATARLVAQCRGATANSPMASRILAKAVDSLAESSRGYNRLGSQFHRDVITPLDRTEHLLAKLAPLLSQEEVSQKPSPKTPQTLQEQAPKKVPQQEHARPPQNGARQDNESLSTP